MSSQEKKQLIQKFVKQVKDGELTEDDLQKVSGGTTVNQLHYDMRYDFKSDELPEGVGPKRR